IKLPMVILLLTLLVQLGPLWIPFDYQYLINPVVFWGLILFAATFLLRILQTTFEYLGYAYKFDEESFQVTRGYFVRREIAIAYHQVQNVVIKRNISDRFLHVSQIIIFTVGN